jgi:hypothetical protein
MLMHEAVNQLALSGIVIAPDIASMDIDSCLESRTSSFGGCVGRDVITPAFFMGQLAVTTVFQGQVR